MNSTSDGCTFFFFIFNHSYKYEALYLEAAASFRVAGEAVRVHDAGHVLGRRERNAAVDAEALHLLLDAGPGHYQVPVHAERNHFIIG